MQRIEHVLVGMLTGLGFLIGYAGDIGHKVGGQETGPTSIELPTIGNSAGGSLVVIGSPTDFESFRGKSTAMSADSAGAMPPSLHRALRVLGALMHDGISADQINVTARVSQEATEHLGAADPRPVVRTGENIPR